MVEPTEWIRGILGALADERAQCRRPEGAERLIVDGTARISCENGRHLYECIVPGTGRIPGLASGELLIGARTRMVEVLVESWPSPGVVRLWANEDLGPRPGAGELLFRADHVLEMLERRVSELRSPLEERIEWMYGSGGYERRSTGLTETPIPDLRALNQGQAEAVCTALNEPVARIWGPPGTGKSTTAGVLAATWIRSGRRILLGGPTHRSVDLLLASVLESLRWEPGKVDGRIVRLGDISAGALPDPWTRVVSVDALQMRRRAEAEDALQRVRHEVKRLRQALKTQPGSDTASELESRLESRFERLRALEAQAGTTVADLLSRAQVVATTAHRIALGRVAAVDAVILDEASMVSLPVGLLASLCAPQLTLVGDPRQLGPVVRARTVRARRWLGASVFDDARTSRGGLPQMNGPCALLTEQFRMPPAVCRVVSAFAYEGRLKPADTVAHTDESDLKVGKDRTSVLYVCTSRIPRPRASAPPSRHRENPQQAQLVMRVLSAVVDETPELRGRTAVLSPYRAHVVALRTAAREAGLEAAVQVSTVHRAQGHEYRFVVLSIPERWGDRLGGFLGARSAAEAGGRLLTVAISRASERLVVVGDLPWLARASPRGGVVRRFLTLLKTHGKPLMLSEAETGMSEPRV